MAARGGNEVEIVVTSKDKTRQGFDQATGNASRFGGSMKRIGETAAGFLSAQLISRGTQAIADFVGGSISGAREYGNAVSSLQNKIDGLGSKSFTTVGHLEDYARSLQGATGKSREAVMAGQDMLLTFHDIRNEAGQGNDIFDQATSVLTDMTAQMNNGKVTQEGMSKQAIQLGKALNDPVKGMTALRRVGVQFTDQQTEQIKKLVESGDKLGAQKIILGELKSEFGGAAKASSTSMDRLHNSVHDAQIAIGNGLLPIVEAGTKILTKLANIVAKHPGLMMALAAVVGGVLVLAFTAWAISAGAAAVATLAAAAPILAIIAVIALLVVGIFLLVKHWHTVWGAVVSVAKAAWHGVTGAIGAAWGWIKSVVGNIASFFRNAWNRAKNAVVSVAGSLITFVKGIPGKILRAVGALDRLLYNAGKAVIQGLINGIKAMVGAVGNAVSSVASKIRNFLPFSPAKEGPLSGAGSPFLAGRKISQMVSEGITAGAGAPAGAMGRALQPLAGGGGSGAPGGGVVRLEIHSGGSRLDSLLMEILRKSVRAKGGNVQIALGADG